ncbi:DHHC zinc finger domain-containing protein [Besnoitia besnoiti]|uniref:Palmitoyltransferase n=1 Tax=Besnoitia besnoiti TaxID=94643 RepID=A0A2A9M1H4_BESBE|nr:DHHC zinc finger domain-containing protein [Besnoitia besnoiti]PFH31094.1 DHHC zinc finger domain-containing protein [Besnoitia besnoiti]
MTPNRDLPEPAGARVHPAACFSEDCVSRSSSASSSLPAAAYSSSPSPGGGAWDGECGAEAIEQLFLLLRCGKGKAVKSLLKRLPRAVVHARDAGGHTLLHWAALCGEIEVLKFLLARGADPDARAAATRQTPLMWSIIRDNIVAMRLLLDTLESPSAGLAAASGPVPAAAAPHAAPAAAAVPSLSSPHAASGAAGVAEAPAKERQLAGELGGWRARDSKGATCAILAAQHDSRRALLLLVRRAGRACLDETDENGCSPAHWAAFKNHVEVLRLLHYFEADFTSIDLFGCLALHRAVEAGQLEACKVLVEECDVSRNERNTKSNVSALELAESLQPPRPDLVAFLRAPHVSRPTRALPLLQASERPGRGGRWQSLRRMTNLFCNWNEPLKYKHPSIIVLFCLLLMIYTSRVTFACLRPSRGAQLALPHFLQSPCGLEAHARASGSSSAFASLFGSPPSSPRAPCPEAAQAARGDAQDLGLFLLVVVSDPGIIRKRRRGASAVEELMQILGDRQTSAETLAALDPDRLCRSCWVYRALRTKHCFVCDRCVEGFDHHCLWSYNCVGALNARLFTSWLLYHFATQLLHLCCSLAFLSVSDSAGEPSFTDAVLHGRCPNRALLLFTTLLHGLTLPRLSVLVYRHLRNIAENVTANEVLNRSRYAYLWRAVSARGQRAVRGARKSVNPFSAGVWKNCVTFWLGRRTFYSASVSNALLQLRQLFPPLSPSAAALARSPAHAQGTSPSFVSRLLSFFSVSAILAALRPCRRTPPGPAARETQPDESGRGVASMHREAARQTRGGEERWTESGVELRCFASEEKCSGRPDARAIARGGKADGVATTAASASLHKSLNKGKVV